MKPSSAERAVAPQRLASRIGEVAAAVLAGIVAYLASCIVEPALAQPSGFGLFWREMSTRPFDFVGDLPHRMLAPLLAHLVGLDGDRYTDFTRLTGVLMLSLVYAVCRHRGALAFDACLVTLAIALTGATQIYKNGMVGYCDNLGYSLFLVGVLVARHGWAFWPVYFLNLVNHDMALFFLPWLWFLRRQQVDELPRPRWTRTSAQLRVLRHPWLRRRRQLRRLVAALGAQLPDVCGCIAVLAAYVWFRRYVGEHAATWLYDAQYFRKNCFLPISFVWLWMLAGVHMLLQFGPFLAILLWHSWWPRPPRERVHTLLILVGIGGILCFAYDMMRHPNMIFLPVMFASLRFLVDARSRAVYGLSIAAMVVLYRTCTWLEPGGPPSLGWMFDRIVGIMTFDCHGHLIIDESFRFNLAAHWGLLKCAASRVWPEFFGLCWEVLGIVALSRWYLRANIGGPRWRA